MLTVVVRRQIWMHKRRAGAEFQVPDVAARFGHDPARRQVDRGQQGNGNSKPPQFLRTLPYRQSGRGRSQGREVVKPRPAICDENVRFQERRALGVRDGASAVVGGLAGLDHRPDRGCHHRHEHQAAQYCPAVPGGERNDERQPGDRQPDDWQVVQQSMSVSGFLQQVISVEFSRVSFHNRVWRRRRALLITETELKLMAAPAMMGLSSRPKNG